MEMFVYLYRVEICCNIDARFLRLNTDIEDSRELNVTNWLYLNDEREIEYSSRSGLVRRNCSRRNICCAGRSVNLQFDFNLAISVTAGRE
jgi:hypothetical protein